MKSKINHQEFPKVNADISELIGALTGDGFIGNYGERKQQYIIQFAGNKLNDRLYFKHLSNLIRKINPDVSQKFKYLNNTMWMTIYSKKLYMYFKNQFNFPTGKKGNKLHIPSIIKDNDVFTRKFIRGLIDTDGYLYFDKRKSYRKPYPRIQLEISSEKLFKEVSNYLSKLFRMRTTTRIRHGKFKIHSLEIYGHTQLKKWNKLIGFSNKKHLQKMPL